MSDKFVPGTVVYMKTTEEPLLVLETYSAGDPDYEGFSGNKISVRRPLLTDEGLKYAIDDFYTEEVETLDDKNARQFNEINNRFGSFATKKTEPSLH